MEQHSSDPDAPRNQKMMSRSVLTSQMLEPRFEATCDPHTARRSTPSGGRHPTGTEAARSSVSYLGMDHLACMLTRGCMKAGV